MELTNFQKDIIKKIATGEICDLCSFFSNFFKNAEYKDNYEDIKKKKKQDYENNKGNIDEYLKSLKKINCSYDMATLSSIFNTSDYSTEEIENFRKQLSNYEVNSSDFDYEVQLKDKAFKVNTLKEGVYLLDDKYQKMLDFLCVWQLLQSEQLILTLPSEINDKIAKLFFRKEYNLKEEFNKDFYTQDEIQEFENLSQHQTVQSVIREKKYKTIMPLLFDEKKFYKKDDKEYSDIILRRDNKTILISENYIDKKILALPSLNLFIQSEFRTSDERKYRKEHRLTLIAIYISIIFSILSLGLSWHLSSNDNKFWSNNEYIRTQQYIEMNKSLSDINENLLKINGNIDNEKLIVDEIKKDTDKISELIQNVKDTQR